MKTENRKKINKTESLFFQKIFIRIEKLLAVLTKKINGENIYCQNQKWKRRHRYRPHGHLRIVSKYNE